MSTPTKAMPTSRQIRDLRADMPNLEPISAAAAIRMHEELMILNMFTHGANPALDERLVTVFKDLNPGGMFPFVPPGQRILPLATGGPPGHAKTTALATAARDLARRLGMRYTKDPSEDMLVDADTVLMLNYQFAGLISLTLLSGMPAILQRDPVTGRVTSGPLGVVDVEASRSLFQGIIPDYRAHAIRQAGLSVVNLDDLLRAPINVISGALPMLYDKLYNTMRLSSASTGALSYVTTTFNLGMSADGTHSQSMDGPTMGRMEARMLVVEPGEWAAHTRAEAVRSWPGIAGRDMGYATAIETDPNNILHDLPAPDSVHAVSQPRTHSDMVRSLVALLARHGGRSAITAPGMTERIEDLAMSHTGPRGRVVVGGFYRNLAAAMNNPGIKVDTENGPAVAVATAWRAAGEPGGLETAAAKMWEETTTTLANGSPIIRTAALREFLREVAAVHNVRSKDWDSGDPTHESDPARLTPTAAAAVLNTWSKGRGWTRSLAAELFPGSGVKPSARPTP